MPVSLDGLMIMVVEDDLLAALDLARLVEQRRTGQAAGAGARTGAIGKAQSSMCS